jgi:hypothetical protein
MLLKRLCFAFVVIVLMTTVMYRGALVQGDERAGQTEPVVTPAAPPPVLTEVQKLTVQNLVQQMQLSQQAAQIAQMNAEKTRADLLKLLDTLQVKGYTLDLPSLTYQRQVTLPDAPKAGAK